MIRPCSTPGCERPSEPDRRPCYACRKKAYRAAHPIRDAFHAHRHHAKERRIPTELEFHEFALICQETGYHALRGQGADSLTLDRHDAEEGYHLVNVRVMPRSENCRKWWEVDRPRRMAVLLGRAA